MPEIKYDRVISVSSEDKKYPASNLMGSVGIGKWKSAKPGEKSLSVILQFQRPSKISSLHIANEGSAFVEVLVGKETTSSDHDWKVLLVASSMMTPADARAHTNRQKVRMFGPDSLSKSALEDTWDRIKVVCTQPFDKVHTYGLSFISCITEEGGDDVQADSQSQKLGSFTLADTDSDDMSKPSGGSVFSERARLQASIPPPTAAAAVRAAARDADVRVGTQSASKPSKPAESKKTETKKPDSRPLKRAASPDEKVESKKSKPVKTDPPAPARKSTSTESSRAKPSTTSAKSTSASVDTPFKELMKGVVFALSGFKNPKRSDLREKAIQMGAKYSPDWDKKCSHLICAFASTPKFAQVDGEGYIVGEDWILDSHRRKTKLPWRDYRLGRAKTPPRAKQDEKQDSKPPAEETAASAAPVAADKFEGDTDVDTDEEAAAPGPEFEATQVDSDATEVDSMDTDDEIAAHMAKNDDDSEPSTSTNKGKSPASGKQPVTKQSNGSTSQSSYTKRPLPILPDYLKDKVFFLYGNVNARSKVYRYIYAYGGEVEEYMCDEVQFVVTDDTWDDNFDSALSDNANLIFVKSKWIIDTHTKQQSIPHQKYAVVPS